MNLSRKIIISMALSCVLPVAAIAHEHGGDAEVKVSASSVAGNITMLQAGGGNIAVSSGEDGIFVIDDNVPDTSGPVMAAIKKLGNKPIRVLINTHWHYDHTGNNEAFGNNNTIIMAQQNVRKRMKNGQSIPALGKEFAPYPKSALPLVTYEDGVSLHVNGDDMLVMHVKNAHTDGDSIIYWARENVIHTGDIFFNGMYPFVDASSGGSLKGVISASEKILEMADADTKIIPGHGPLASKQDLERYVAMLKTVADRIQQAKDAGKSTDAFVKENPFADLDKEWGKGFLPTDKFTAIIYEAL